MRTRKIVLLAILLVLWAAGVSAQSDTLATAVKPAAKYGCVSYERVLKAMPDYALTQQQLTDLRAQYDAEMKRVEQEFNRKYEEFLDGQRDFPRTILLKRQTELKELMERNVTFKHNAQQELARAEADAMAPLHQKLNEALAAIARERGYDLIVNTDGNACPYLNPDITEDINDDVIASFQ